MKKKLIGVTVTLLIGCLPIGLAMASKAETLIKVQKATYGNFEDVKYQCDATAMVAFYCNGRTSCQFAVEDTLCGFDPAPGMDKDVVVNYSCGLITKDGGGDYQTLVTLSCP